MDSSHEVGSEVKSGEKRVAEDAGAGGGGGGGGPVAKKVKTGGLMGNVKKVAEMVLLLAAMGKMRGGRVPSEVELDIMSTAREKLAEVCQCFPPKDMFPREVFGAIIDDLGLDRINEHKLQFRPPKVTIAEKFLLSKRKMEKSEELSQHPATSGSQRLASTNSGVTVENHGPPHAVGVLSSEKSNHRPIASGNFQTASPFGHATNSSSLPYQLPTSEVRPVSSSGFPSNHLGRDSTPVSIQRTDRPHFSMDRRSNGPSHVSYPQANTPAWSLQSLPIASNKGGTEAKVPMQPMIKLKGAADAKSGMVSQASTSKPIIAQSSSGNVRKLHQHSQVINPIQAAIPRNTHAEIGNIVQKFLHPQSADPPVWIPPSRDYMNQPLPCQVCNATINDVDSVLVCDTCEKGFHLKCLQINNARGIPKGDWHCRRCLQLSHGKPLPPKYGRVMRNMSAPKVPMSTSSPQSNKKTGSPHEKINQQKPLPNGNTEPPSVPNVSAVTNFSHPSPAPKCGNPREIQQKFIVTEGKRVKEESATENTTQTSGMDIVSPSAPSAPSAPSVKGIQEEKMLELKALPVPESETKNSSSGNSHSFDNRQDNELPGLPHDAVLAKQPCDNHILGRPLNNPCGAEGLCDSLRQESSFDDRGTEQANSASTATAGDGSAGLERPLSDAGNNVDWVGDMLRAEDDKIFYQSCSINGVVYKLNDHVLIHISDDRSIPSKLQSMWEDNRTKIKWIAVNRCYFPGDLPEAVGRPCSLESSEVFESTCGFTVMADLIRGLCDILPPSKFSVEKERRSSLGMESNNSLRPLYLCKWIYDESKGIFRDVSS